MRRAVKAVVGVTSTSGAGGGAGRASGRLLGPRRSKSVGLPNLEEGVGDFLMRLRRGASSISSVCNSRRGGSFVTACSHRVHARRPRRVTIMDGALDSLSVAYSQVVVALPAGQHVSGSAARQQSYRRFVTAGSRACGQKETAAWVEGGGTPRPPLELGGSRPDGGGGRHRPAASSRDDAWGVPAGGRPGIHALNARSDE